MIDRILDTADPYIADLIWALIVAPILERVRWVFKTKESREALHKALQTGIDKVTDLMVPIILANPLGFQVDQFAGRVADHVFDSVPDALRFLLGNPWFMRLFGMKSVPPEQQRAFIEGMAAAKLKAWAADYIAKLGPDVLARDPLAQVLRDAGAPIPPA